MWETFERNLLELHPFVCPLFGGSIGIITDNHLLRHSLAKPIIDSWIVDLGILLLALSFALNEV